MRSLIAWRHAQPMRRGIAMLEYALILMFTSVMMIVVTYTVLRLLPDYFRVLLGTIISATV